MSSKLPAFKAYDIRGRVPDQLDAFMAYCIGRAYVRVMSPRGPVAVGRDIRSSSPELSSALIGGLNREGVEVIDIGICGTEMIYHAAAQEGMGGGIVVTASHNPVDYNGMKLVREGARPISADTGLGEIEAVVVSLMAAGDRPDAYEPIAGLYSVRDILPGYIDKVLSMVDREVLRPLHLVVNAGNGCAGPVFDAIAARLNLNITRIHHEPDPSFPNGVPNPMLVDQQKVTSEAVISSQADLGLAWDGDFDRCFFFDEKGNFIEGYYLVGMIAETLLEHGGGGRIVHDPRLYWNTRAVVEGHGGKTVFSKCGHSFIKDKMREVDALYGGEMSAHHYFRDFYYCDSGMIPWLLVLERLSKSGLRLSELVDSFVRRFPCSGELNFRVGDAGHTLALIRDTLAPEALSTDTLDGISMDFGSWRFNLRSSNTEPVIRLNVESDNDKGLMETARDRIVALIEQ